MTDTLNSQVERLLRRTDASGPDERARALLDDIALTLHLQPRCVLYLAHLARNGLLYALSQELARLEELGQLVEDLAHRTLPVTDTRSLQRSRNLLLQLESLTTLDATSELFQRFEGSVRDFLSGPLGRNVRRQGELVRPAAEARAALPDAYTALQEAHAETLRRLYALVVSVDNFLALPLTVLAGGAVRRVRDDYEQMLKSIKAGQGEAQGRELVTRLIAGRATLKALGRKPDIYAPVVSTEARLPGGRSLGGVSLQPPLELLGSEGPWAWPATASVTVALGGLTRTVADFPAPGLDLSGQSVLLTAPLDPATLTGELYLRYGGTSKRIELAADGTWAGLLAAFSAQGVQAARYFADTSRLLIYGPSLSVEPYFLQTVPSVVLYQASAHAALGLRLGEVPEGKLPGWFLVGAFSHHFGDLLQPTLDAGRLRLRALSALPGAHFHVEAPLVLELGGYHLLQSRSFRLVDESGVYEPLPEDLLGVGDVVVTPSGTARVVAFEGEVVHLDALLDAFDGPLVVRSALSEAYSFLQARLEAYLPVWLATGYAHTLEPLERPVAALVGDDSPMSRTSVLEQLTALRLELLALQAVLSAADTALPAQGAQGERKQVEALLGRLAEERYGRAQAALLEGRVHDFFSMNAESATYGGALMASVSGVARQDLDWPNAAQRER